jgi:Tfp pilus assembly protein FimT
MKIAPARRQGPIVSRPERAGDARPGPRFGRRPSGFTLIELILIMALIVIMAAVVTPRMAGFFRGRTLDNEARRFVTLTRHGQNRAVSEGIPILVWIDEEKQLYGVEAQPGYLEKDDRALEYPVADELTIEAGEPLTSRGTTLSPSAPAGTGRDTRSIRTTTGMRCANRHRSAFTLAEVLAALAFMAIVIPVLVQGIQIASRAGQVGARKAVAARIADRVVSELEVTGELLSGAQSGVVREGGRDYQWRSESRSWLESELDLVTVRVDFEVQGDVYHVNVSTLIDPNLAAFASTNSTSSTP